MMLKRFTIKKEHLTLLQRFEVGWQDCEFGAPEIDPKRPYGNSNVIQDMVEVLGFKAKNKKTFEFTLFGKKYLLNGEDKHNLELDDEEELVQTLDDLHRETETALQICLERQKFETGTFEAEEYGGKWKKVK